MKKIAILFINVADTVTNRQFVDAYISSCVMYFTGKVHTKEGSWNFGTIKVVIGETIPEATEEIEVFNVVEDLLPHYCDNCKDPGSLIAWMWGKLDFVAFSDNKPINAAVMGWETLASTELYTSGGTKAEILERLMFETNIAVCQEESFGLAETVTTSMITGEEVKMGSLEEQKEFEPGSSPIGFLKTDYPIVDFAVAKKVSTANNLIVETQVRGLGVTERVLIIPKSENDLFFNLVSEKKEFSTRSIDGTDVLSIRENFRTSEVIETLAATIRNARKKEMVLTTVATPNVTMERIGVNTTEEALA